MRLITGSRAPRGEETLIRAPLLRYADSAPRAAPDLTAWVERDHGCWTWSDTGLRLDVRAVDTGEGATSLELSATALSPVRVALCACVLEVGCVTPPYFVDRHLDWRAAQGDEQTGDFTPFVVRWEPGGGAARELRPAQGTPPACISWKKGLLRITLYLDAAALHPRWQFSPSGRVSTAAPARREGEVLTARFIVRPVEEAAAPPAIAGRFPGGMEAAFVLTDHSDFDDNGRLRLFLEGDGRDNGWSGKGLRLTKGVFLYPSPATGRKAAPTLDDPAYSEMIDALHSEGSEIAPHALSETGTVTPESFRSGLRAFSTRWAPATWIDHGNTIRYCYSMGGAADPAYDLLGALRAGGFTTLWSYHDAYAHGCATLNLLDAPVSGTGRMALRFAAHVIGGEILIALHYIRSILERSLRGKWAIAVLGGITALRALAMDVRGRGRLSAGAVRGAIGALRAAVRRAGSADAGGLSEPYTRRELAAFGAAVYPERALPLQQAAGDDLLLFATIEGVHTRDIYTPRALDRLIAERGLHIGHTYLLNDLPYIAGVFGHGARISGAWTRFLPSLSRAVASGALWNPPAGELSRWMRSFQGIAVVPGGTCRLLLVNSGPAAVTGFTLLLPRAARRSSVRWSDAAPRGFREWRDWCAAWGDLPAASTTVVAWEEESR